jgi:hypothetical protein
MRTKLAMVILAALLITPVVALAHHAFNAEFDGTKEIKLSGKVTKMEWINPHAWVHIDVKNADGSITPWMVELAAPNALLRRGWTKEDLLAGVEINVQGYQAKDGANRANGSIVTFASSGKKLFVGSSNPDAIEYQQDKAKK